MAKFQTQTRVIRNSGPRKTLHLPSIPKGVGRLPTESAVEYAGLLDMAFDKDIRSFKVQPRRFELSVLGRAARYTPDAEYVRQNGVIGYVEFKHSLDDLDDEERALLRAARTTISAEGFEYTVRDLEQIRSGHRLENIRLLRRYSRIECSEALAREALSYVEQQPQVTLQDLREFAGQSRFTAVMRLLWDQRICFDMCGESLAPHTLLWVRGPL